MTNESTENKNTAKPSTEALMPEETLVQEIIDQAEEQGEVQNVFVHDVISAEQEKINKLELSLSSAQTTIADQKDSVVRAKAEVDNIRRRSAQDVDKARKFALEKFAAEMLVSVDNLERALENIDKEDESNTAIIEGVELTLQGLIASLEKFGVKGVDPQNEPFNPELHQAMSMQEVEGVAPNTVIAVMQKGYELNGRLIRPAMVMVSKSAPAVDTTV
ncbi:MULTISPECIES: nucleotide exchange factor GrpE [unclassified Colwellia]|uniref:nucleotide exchange factor GrpE n=2 Tax=unclassified Colwellia TaxID=196834 RepID=UPI0038557D80